MKAIDGEINEWTVYIVESELIQEGFRRSEIHTMSGTEVDAFMTIRKERIKRENKKMNEGSSEF